MNYKQSILLTLIIIISVFLVIKQATLAQHQETERIQFYPYSSPTLLTFDNSSPSLATSPNNVIEKAQGRFSHSMPLFHFGPSHCVNETSLATSSSVCKGNQFTPLQTTIHVDTTNKFGAFVDFIVPTRANSLYLVEPYKCSMDPGFFPIGKTIINCVSPDLLDFVDITIIVEKVPEITSSTFQSTSFITSVYKTLSSLILWKVLAVILFFLSIILFPVLRPTLRYINYYVNRLKEMVQDVKIFFEKVMILIIDIKEASRKIDRLTTSVESLSKENEDLRSYAQKLQRRFESEIHKLDSNIEESEQKNEELTTSIEIIKKKEKEFLLNNKTTQEKELRNGNRNNSKREEDTTKKGNDISMEELHSFFQKERAEKKLEARLQAIENSIKEVKKSQADQQNSFTTLQQHKESEEKLEKKYEEKLEKRIKELQEVIQKQHSVSEMNKKKISKQRKKLIEYENQFKDYKDEERTKDDNNLKLIQDRFTKCEEDLKQEIKNFESSQSQMNESLLTRLQGIANNFKQFDVIKKEIEDMKKKFNTLETNFKLFQDVSHKKDKEILKKFEQNSNILKEKNDDMSIEQNQMKEEVTLFLQRMQQDIENKHTVINQRENFLNEKLEKMENEFKRLEYLIQEEHTRTMGNFKVAEEGFIQLTKNQVASREELLGYLQQMKQFNDSQFHNITQQMVSLHNMLTEESGNDTDDGEVHETTTRANSSYFFTQQSQQMQPRTCGQLHQKRSREFQETQPMLSRDMFTHLSCSNIY